MLVVQKDCASSVSRCLAIWRYSQSSLQRPDNQCTGVRSVACNMGCLSGQVLRGLQRNEQLSSRDALQHASTHKTAACTLKFRGCCWPPGILHM